MYSEEKRRSGHFKVHGVSMVKESSTDTVFVCDQPRDEGSEVTCRRNPAERNDCKESDSCSFSILKILPGVNCSSSCIAIGWPDYEAKYSYFSRGKATEDGNCGSTTTPLPTTDHVTSASAYTSKLPLWTSTTANATTHAERTSALPETTRNERPVAIQVGVACFLLIAIIAVTTAAAIFLKRRRESHRKAESLSDPQPYARSGDGYDVFPDEGEGRTTTLTQGAVGGEDNDAYAVYIPAGSIYCSIADNEQTSEKFDGSQNHDRSDSDDNEQRPMLNKTKCPEEDDNVYTRLNNGRKAPPVEITNSLLATYNEGISVEANTAHALAELNNSPTTSNTGDSTYTAIAEVNGIYYDLESVQDEVYEDSGAAGNENMLPGCTGPVDCEATKCSEYFMLEDVCDLELGEENGDNTSTER